MARFGSYAIPGFLWFLIWVVFVVLLIILLAFIVHQAGGGIFILKLGHFSLQIGVS